MQLRALSIGNNHWNCSCEGIDDVANVSDIRPFLLTSRPFYMTSFYICVSVYSMIVLAM